MAVFLIRHGETDLNAARVVQFPDTPLGSVGHEQAERLGQHLARTNIGLILTSDYQRARSTAEKVASHTGAPLIEHSELRERHFGEIRGSSYEELEPIDIFALDYIPPNGESWPLFNERVDRAWDFVTGHTAAVQGDIAVITHGLVLRSLIERRLDVSDQSLDAEFVVANTSVTVVEPSPPWRVLSLAETIHLEDGPNDTAPV